MIIDIAMYVRARFPHDLRPADAVYYPNSGTLHFYTALSAEALAHRRRRGPPIKVIRLRELREGDGIPDFEDVRAAVHQVVASIHVWRDGANLYHATCCEFCLDAYAHHMYCPVQSRRNLGEFARHRGEYWTGFTVGYYGAFDISIKPGNARSPFALGVSVGQAARKEAQAPAAALTTADHS